jgi:hypothetical protein
VHRRDENYIKHLLRKAYERYHLEGLVLGAAGKTVKIDLRETRCVDWIHLAADSTRATI